MLTIPVLTLTQKLINSEPVQKQAHSKGSLTRDFQLLVFFHESVSPGFLVSQIGNLYFFTKICEDINKQRLITGVNDACNK